MKCVICKKKIKRTDSWIYARTITDPVHEDCWREHALEYIKKQAEKEIRVATKKTIELAEKQQ